MAGAAHYHLSVKSVGRATRSGGVKSATAAAAYRSGGVVEMACYRAAEATLERATGQVHDYTRKTGVLESHLLLPDGAPDWNRSRLWNEAERAEPRKNGRIATEIEVALPKELSRDQQRELALGFAQGIVDRYHVAADVNLHQGKHPDNVHAHMMFSHRELGSQGFGDIANRHLVEKGGRQVEVAGLVAQPRDVEALRAGWQRHVNRAYERAGHELRVDHRSYQRQGVSREPTRYLGPRQSDPERSRLREERAAYNERVMARRQERERQAIDRAVRQREGSEPDPEAAFWAGESAKALAAKEPRQRQRQAAHEDPARVRLRAMGAEEPEHEAAALRVVPTAEDLAPYAREISPAYAAADRRAWTLKRQIHARERWGKDLQTRAEVAVHRQGERWQEMSRFGRLIDYAIRQDPELARWRREEDRTRRVMEKNAIKISALGGALRMAERNAAAELRKVRPAATARYRAIQELLAQGEREDLRQAPRPEPKVQKTQKQAPVAVQTQTLKTKAEEQEDAVDRYVQGIIARARSRPEQQAEEEQRQAQKARPAAGQRERPEQAPRQEQAQGQRPEERQEQRAQKRQQGQAMSQEERAKAYWQGLVARGRALKDEGEEERLRQTQRQTLRHGPRMGM